MKKLQKYIRSFEYNHIGRFARVYVCEGNRGRQSMCWLGGDRVVGTLRLLDTHALCREFTYIDKRKNFTGLVECATRVGLSILSCSTKSFLDDIDRRMFIFRYVDNRGCAPHQMWRSCSCRGIPYKGVGRFHEISSSLQIKSWRAVVLAYRNGCQVSI